MLTTDFLRARFDERQLTEDLRRGGEGVESQSALASVQWWWRRRDQGEGSHAQEDLDDTERRRPLRLEDVEADEALAVDVAVVDPRLERHLQRRDPSPATSVPGPR